MNDNENNDNNNNIEMATLGTGCFWCTEAIFQQVNGVINVRSGYSGGDVANPDYKTVCTGVTNHAECLEITYEPSKISFEELLEIFWKTHDPTTPNRQGNDIGSQYRSVIFYHGDNQKEIAQKYKMQLDGSGIFSKPIVTTLEPYSKFYPAEPEHVNYYRLNGNAPYCQFVVRPKVEKFVKAFGDKIRH